MKKNLYLLGAVLISSTIYSQKPETIVKYGFEGDEIFGVNNTGYAQYENFYDDWLNSGGMLDKEYPDGLEGKCLYVASPTTNNTWERGFRLRNLEILPNTSYRLSYWVKGNSDYTENMISSFMCGESNADMPFVADGTNKATT